MKDVQESIHRDYFHEVENSISKASLSERDTRSTLLARDVGERVGIIIEKDAERRVQFPPKMVRFSDQAKSLL